MKPFCRNIGAAFAAAVAGAIAVHSAAMAQLTIDFESADQLEGLGIVTGNLDFYTESTDQANGGAQSLRYDDSAPQYFRSMTYDLPFDIDEGQVTVWFYDTVGPGAPLYQWGMSIMLESVSDTSDFGAVEIVRTHGTDNYRGSEGSVDRLASPDKFDSLSFPARTVGWHRIDFDITAGETTISIDGSASTEIAAPGSNVGDLRLRIMADSPSVGGSGNWTSAATGFPATQNIVYIDNIAFTATTPASATDTLDFEDTDMSGLGNGSGDPEYDVVPEFMVSPGYDETNMRGFVNGFETTTAQAHSGTNAIAFTGSEPVLKSLVFDLSSASPGTITIPFYDSLGPNEDFDKVGGAVIIEDGSDPSNFIAMEVWNAEYPFGPPQGTYYFVARPIPASTSGFFSSYFPTRSVGWQTLTIELTNTYSRMTVNGLGQDAANGNVVYDGPGLNTNPKLRIMADSPSLGGSKNWQDSSTWTDPGSPELDILNLDKGADYVYYDDLALPLPANTSVTDWTMY